MVGVKGKSQACHDCKRRRVKCDLGRPSCLRCEKAKICCGGYEQAVVFVNRTPASLSTTAASVFSDLKSQSIQHSALPGPQCDLKLQWFASQISKPSFPRLQFRQYALELLRKMYLPQPSQTNQAQGISRSSHSWLQASCELAGPSEALDYSLLTFCVIQIHVTEKSTTLEEALQLYNTSVQKLWLDIDDRRAGEHDEILAAIVVLSTCELFVCPTDHGWRAHARGVSEILRLRGLSESPAPAWHDLCSRLRLICVLLGLVKHTAPLLTPAEWSKIMSTRDKTTRFDELIDIIADIPALLEKADTLIASSRNSTPNWNAALLRSLLSLADRLDSWQCSFRADHSTSQYWAMHSRLHNPSDDASGSKLFPFSLEFESLDSAILLILYWSTLLETFSAILRLYNAFFSDPSSPPPTLEELLTHDLHQNPGANAATPSDPLPSPSKFASIPTIKAEADGLARYLCQSIEFCHRVEMGTLGPQATCYAQWAMRSYFRHGAGYERELAWCSDIKNMRGRGSRCGIELMTFQDL